MQFEIINPKSMNKNTLRGFFTLKAGPLEIEGYSFHEKSGKTWVNPPSREYRDKESNEMKYASIIKIPDKDRYWKFQEWACAECELLFASKQQSKNSETPF
jgi:hypothetical protein